MNGARRRIDFGAVNLAFAVVMAAFVAVLSYGNFNGSTAARIDGLQREITVLRADMDGLRREMRRDR